MLLQILHEWFIKSDFCIWFHDLCFKWYTMNDKKKMIRRLVGHIIFQSQHTSEPINRRLGDSCEIVLVIHIIQSKPDTVTVVPFPVIKQWPHKITLHIAFVFPASVSLFVWMICFWSSKNCRKCRGLAVPYSSGQVWEIVSVISYPLVVL